MNKNTRWILIVIFGTLIGFLIGLGYGDTLQSQHRCTIKRGILTLTKPLKDCAEIEYLSIKAWKEAGLCEKNNKGQDVCSIPNTVSTTTSTGVVKGYKIDKPIEYPLESENIKIGKKSNGQFYIDFKTCDPSVGNCVTEKALRELYQLLKSKYE